MVSGQLAVVSRQATLTLTLTLILTLTLTPTLTLTLTLTPNPYLRVMRICSSCVGSWARSAVAFHGTGAPGRYRRDVGEM